MKKSIAVLALLIAASGYAGEVVYSANIVGVQKVSLAPGYNFIGVNFESFATNGTYSIQDILDTSALKGGMTAGASDQVMVWDDANQVYVRYWLFNSGGNYPAYDGKWLKWDGSALADQELGLGSGFWYVNTASTNVEQVLSGNVNVDATFTHSLVEGYNMVATAYPVTQAVNSMDWTGFQGAMTAGASDQLVFWDAAAQKYVRVWLFDSGGSFPAYDGKWLKWDGSALADNVIESGVAVWAIRQAAGDVSENKPF